MIEMEAMFENNETMIKLTGVPLGQGLAPNYPLRKEYIEICKLAGTKATKPKVAKLEKLILVFRAKANPRPPKKRQQTRRQDTAELGVLFGCFDGPDEEGWYYTAGGTPFSPEDL